MTEHRKQKIQNTVLLVDDHPVFRKGLLSLLEDEEDIFVIGEAGDGQTALALVKELSPDIVVMDVAMPGINGIEATKRIVSKFPNIKVVALSIHSEKQFVLDMLQAGAAGYIEKESVPEEFVKGIRSVMFGYGYLSPAITEVVVSQFKNSTSLQHLFTESTIELLDTKLHTPRLSDYHVHRPRLVTLLEQNRRLPLQTITAPAGYGKSTLAGCWLTSHEWPHAWLSLDDNDNDLRRFISYLLYAVKTLFPGALPKSTALLASPNLPPLPVFTSTLINEMELVEQDFILAFDDFHLIKKKEVYDLLAELLGYPPAPMHLVVIGRTDPFLPASRLRSQGLISELRMTDLQFTPQETGEFLGYMLHRDIDESIAGAWCKKTEGWITGLRLATHSIKNQDELSNLLSNLQGTRQYVMEYLFNEVLADQPENIRKHLITVSIVDKFNASLLEVLYPNAEHECESDGWSIINWMKKHNLYVISLDDENRWFRFHHLFLELLRKQLQRNHSPNEIAEFHSRASQWFEEQGLIDGAIRHALLAEDMAGAAEIFERYRRDEQEDHCLNIIRWHNLFPEDLKKDHSGLLLAQALFLHEQYRLLEIIPIVNRVESIFKDKPPDDISRGELKLFQGILLYWEGKGELSLKLLREAQAMIPLKHARLCGLTEVYVSVASHLTGQGQVNCQRLNNRIREGTHLDGALLSRLILGRSLHYMLSGELTKVMQDIRYVKLLSGQPGLTLPQHWGEYLLAACHFLHNDLEAALPYFATSLEHRYSIHSGAAVDAMIGQALSQQALNMPATASETVALLLEFTHDIHDPRFRILAESCQARLALAQNDLESAVQWLQSFDDTYFGPSTFVFWLEIPSITRARILNSIGSDDSLQQAGELLKPLLQAMEETHNIFQMIEIMPLMAVVYEKQGRADQALDLLDAAVNLARSGGWIRPFVELGTPMEDLLKQLQEQNGAPGYCTTLLAAFKDDSLTTTEGFSRPDSPSLADPLTVREQEVLDHLIQGKSNKEIGEFLFVSIYTVKTHLRSIFNKLDVSSRLQAVTKANALGIAGKTDK